MWVIEEVGRPTKHGRISSVCGIWICVKYRSVFIKLKPKKTLQNKLSPFEGKWGLRNGTKMDEVEMKNLPY